MTKEMNMMIEMIKNAYILTMGIEKWNSLTDKEKHDAVMILVNDMSKALN